MSTDVLNTTECSAQSDKRKSIAIVTLSMTKFFLAEMISRFTILLADRDWEVTVITNNRQNYTDFLLDERVKRFSLDMIYGPEKARQGKLRKFIEENDEITHYLLCNPLEETFCRDFDTIAGMGKKVFIAFWDSMRNVGLNSAKEKRNILERIHRSEATVSSFPLDHFIHGVTYIPVLNPYATGELRQAVLGQKDLLLLMAGSYGRAQTVVRKFARLVEADSFFRDKTLRVVPINRRPQERETLPLKRIAQKYPKNIFLEEFCKKPQKIMDGYAGVIIADNNMEFPRNLAVVVGKGLPALMVKDYADYGIRDFDKGFRICSMEDAALEKELRSFFDSKDNANRVAETLRATSHKTKQAVIQRWEAVLLGHDSQSYEFESNEHVLNCSISYMKGLSQTMLQSYDNAAAYNEDPIVKRAKKRAGRVERRRLLSPTWILRKIRGRIERLIERFHVWERNKRLNIRFIELDATTRRKMQLLILRMYVEFERVCKELGLQYYIAGGTLLGAVRHKGFIPWDDDLDVSMPRKDYDTFLKHAPDMLAEDFHLNANAYPYSFSRLEILGTHMTAPLHRKGRRVFLDVIPLDCACEDEKKKEKQAKLNKKLIFCMCEHARRIPLFYWKYRDIIFRRIWLKLFATHKSMNRRWTKNATKYQSDDAKCWVCLPGEYGYDGETFPKEYWGEPVMMEFEGLLVPGMQEYDAYLTAHYGDYMQPPPETQRGMKHNIYSLSLGKYENMTVEEIAQELSDDYFASTGKRISFLKEAE